MFKGLLNFLFGKKSSSSCCCCGTAGAGSVRDLEGFVDYVVRSLVDSPDEVKVHTEEKDGGNTIHIDCKKEDVGKIVGKHGKTIMAIRSLVRSAAGRMHQMVSVEITD